MKFLKSFSLVAVLVVMVMTLQGNGCFNGNDVTGVGGSGSNKYDGTYDFSFVINHNGTPETTVLSRYFKVTNGNISSNPPQLAGSVLDNFGNVNYSGPCPVNSGNAVFTGILNAGNPKFGQGKWTCNNGGVSNTWRAYNGG